MEGSGLNDGGGRDGEVEFGLKGRGGRGWEGPDFELGR